MLQHSCAVLAVALAAEPALREWLKAAGDIGWPALRDAMQAALSEADRQHLQPMLQQVWH